MCKSSGICYLIHTLSLADFRFTARSTSQKKKKKLRVPGTGTRYKENRGPANSVRTVYFRDNNPIVTRSVADELYRARSTNNYCLFLANVLPVGVFHTTYNIIACFRSGSTSFVLETFGNLFRAQPPAAIFRRREQVRLRLLCNMANFF